jgi:undecaprenyl diphosphate synthase
MTQNNLPQHVAIIMDGNGRWAKKRGLPRTAGHRKGVESVRAVVRKAGEIGVAYLTLFGFSSENWSRPQDEISDLMHLLRFYLRAETADLHKNNVRLRVMGNRGQLDHDIRELIENAEELTKNNTGLRLNIALNYGGRYDIIQAATHIARDFMREGRVPEEEDVGCVFANYLMTSDTPDVDVLIRTSGEQRISNFLLWQCAYAEMLFIDSLWPDFTGDELSRALHEYAMRDRRFGSV